MCYDREPRRLDSDKGLLVMEATTAEILIGLSPVILALLGFAVAWGTHHANIKGHTTKLNDHDTILDNHDTRLKAVELDFTRIDTKLDAIKETLDEMKARLK